MNKWIHFFSYVLCLAAICVILRFVCDITGWHYWTIAFLAIAIFVCGMNYGNSLRRR